MRSPSHVLALLLVATPGCYLWDGRAMTLDAGATDAPPDLRACGERIEAPAGPLVCADAPCRVVENVVIDPPAFRPAGDQPSIAVGPDGLPRILFSRGSFGDAERATLLASRTRSGDWDVTPLPFFRDAGGLVLGSAGCGYVYASADHVGVLHHLDGHATTVVDRIDGHAIAAGRLVIGTAGELRAVGQHTGSWDCFAARWDGRFFAEPLTDPSSFCSAWGAIAVAVDGSRHTAWIDPRTSELVWYARNEGAPEPVHTASIVPPAAGRHGPPLELAVPADGEPRVLFTDLQGSLHFGWRSAGVWETTMLRYSDCTGVDCADDVDFECAGWGCSGYVPVGLVAGSGASVVGLVSVHDVPPFAAEWGRSLYVVAETEGEMRMELLAEDVGGTTGTLALGPDGHLHAAWYEPRPGAPSLVRYVEISP